MTAATLYQDIKDKLATFQENKTDQLMKDIHQDIADNMQIVDKEFEGIPGLIFQTEATFVSEEAELMAHTHQIQTPKRQHLCVTLADLNTGKTLHAFQDEKGPITVEEKDMDEKEKELHIMGFNHMIAAGPANDNDDDNDDIGGISGIGIIIIGGPRL